MAVNERGSMNIKYNYTYMFAFYKYLAVTGLGWNAFTFKIQSSLGIIFKKLFKKNFKC